MSDTTPLPMHPEAGDSALEVRWVVDAATLERRLPGVLGQVTGAPGKLGDLIGEVLVEVSVEPGCVRTRLREGMSWHDWGGPVRDAVETAVHQGGPGWVSRPDQSGGDEANRPHAGTSQRADDWALRVAVQHALAGPTGDYVRSHGGRIELVSAHAGEVEVRLSGTCAHCPAAQLTLDGRLERAVRELYPRLRSLHASEVRPTAPATSRSPGPTFLRLMRRDQTGKSGAHSGDRTGD